MIDKRTKEIALGQAINIISSNKGVPDWNNIHQVNTYSEQVKSLYERILILHQICIK